MKLAVVVQRYGADINGGAEQHARYVAERLARHHEVEVLTTLRTRLRHVGERVARGRRRRPRRARAAVPGRARERDVTLFARRQEAVFDRAHSIQDELAWLDAEGPTSPALLRHVRESRAAYDWFIFFSYRYWHAFHGSRAVADRALLVPDRGTRPGDRPRDVRARCSGACVRSCTTRTRNAR